MNRIAGSEIEDFLKEMTKRRDILFIKVQLRHLARAEFRPRVPNNDLLDVLLAEYFTRGIEGWVLIDELERLIRAMDMEDAARKIRIQIHNDEELAKKLSLEQKEEFVRTAGEQDEMLDDIADKLGAGMLVEEEEKEPEEHVRSSTDAEDGM